jgi:NADH-quinone oxidoreductase subunit K
MIVPFSHMFLLASTLFLCGMVCTVLGHNMIMILIGLEIMLNAAAVAFVAAGLYSQQIEGQVIALFILAVAAAEVSIGLALIVCIYRQTGSIDPGCIESNVCELNQK